MPPRISSIKIKGFRPFGEFEAQLGELEVFVGANGTGKSSLFEFLSFIRDGIFDGVPPEIVLGAVGQTVFHNPGPERIAWILTTNLTKDRSIAYEGIISGPIGRIAIGSESLRETIGNREGLLIQTAGSHNGIDSINVATRENYLLQSERIAALGLRSSTLFPYFELKNYIGTWRFYSSFTVARDKIRKSAVIEQEPLLREDCGNLSSVLHYLITEYNEVFEELQKYLRLIVHGFKSLNVKARGGPGEVIAFWRETGVDTELSLADLSDGILRLLCWMTLCLQPNPPALICIDEPDQGIHPRALPILASLFQRASERTQILLATHSSYFLTHFELKQIAVLRKEKGEAVFVKPSDSKILQHQLADFGPQELEVLHRSDELERLP